MPESANTGSTHKKKALPTHLIAPVVLFSLGLLLVCAGLYPKLAGDERDLVALGVLDPSNSPASESLGPSASPQASSVPAVSSASSKQQAESAVDTVASSDLEIDAANDVAQPVDYCDHVEVYMQFPEVPGACEVASMASVLRAMGYDVSAPQLSDEHLMNLPGSHDMVHGFAGSPYNQGAAFPPIMVRSGNSFLRSQNSEWRFVERKGQPFARLIEVTKTGRPVLVWTTMSLAPPEMTGPVVEGYCWYSNQHCVVLYGQTDEGRLLVMDPLEGLIECDRERFEQVYTECGEMAITMSRVVTAQTDEYEAALDARLREEAQPVAAPAPEPQGESAPEGEPAPEPEG